MDRFIAVLQLSIYAAVYILIFRVRPAGLTEVDYVLLVFSDLVPLMAFNDALMGSTTSLLANKRRFLNTIFPIDLVPLRSALAAHLRWNLLVPYWSWDTVSGSFSRLNRASFRFFGTVRLRGGA